jgi:predicted unusual protein kinase regulating ubiquinone biosynthesis (AarF/ABC1/UbiB family)
LKTIDHIPTGKIQRASKIVKMGAKVGINYLKFFGDKIVTSEEEARKKLNESNAEDIYDELKQLKGSALKVAQMLSMDKSILPQAYVEKFSLAQFSVPPLSPALVTKTFQKYFSKYPHEIFDYFNNNAIHAASIGQVHLAIKNGKNLAVKIQYPGVAESISSDLALVKPFALKLLNINSKDSEQYFKEVEDKLLEETNYLLEIKQGNSIAQACEHIPNLIFPKYYEKYSSERIITMDWMDGEHLSEFTKKNRDKTAANKIGQTLWNFYMYQIHVLKNVHADPHPGNFLISKNKELVALDFGCMKQLPLDFYNPYFELANLNNYNNKSFFQETLFKLEILKNEDTLAEISFLTNMFKEMLSVFSAPFNEEKFDFSDQKFFKKIVDLGEYYAKSGELKKINANRGSKHFIYMNRTFFGLYSLLHELNANQIYTQSWKTLQ